MKKEEIDTYLLEKVGKEMMERITRMINATWNYIGADCLVDEEGEMDESRVMLRDEVWEVCLDADRALIHGGDKEAAKVLYGLPTEIRDSVELKTICLPFINYGW